MESFEKWITSTAALVSMGTAILAAAILVFLHFAERRFVANENKKGERATIIRSLFGVVDFVVILGVILVILQINGINITSMIAGLGIAGAIVGLALQDILKDIIMGIHIVADHFFAVGECVEYSGRECAVLGFSLRTTKLGDLNDHSVITISNRNISEIRRLSDRLDIDVPLSYDESTDEAFKVMEKICEAIGSLENVEKCEFKGTESFENSYILYRIRVFCSAKDRPDVKRAALFEIRKGLDAEGIVIPYAQIDVHFKGEK